MHAFCGSLSQSVFAAFHMHKPEDYPQCFRLILAMQTLDKLQEQRADLTTRQPDADAAKPVRWCMFSAGAETWQVAVPIACTLQGSLLLQVRHNYARQQ